MRYQVPALSQRNAAPVPRSFCSTAHLLRLNEPSEKGSPPARWFCLAATSRTSMGIWQDILRFAAEGNSATARECFGAEVTCSGGLTQTAYDILFSMPERTLGRSDVEFVVKSGKQTLGTLRISKGSLVWFPRGTSIGHRISWQK